MVASRAARASAGDSKGEKSAQDQEWKRRRRRRGHKDQKKKGEKKRGVGSTLEHVSFIFPLIGDPNHPSGSSEKTPRRKSR